MSLVEVWIVEHATIFNPLHQVAFYCCSVVHECFGFVLLKTSFLNDFSLILSRIALYGAATSLFSFLHLRVGLRWSVEIDFSTCIQINDFTEVLNPKFALRFGLREEFIYPFWSFHNEFVLKFRRHIVRPYVELGLLNSFYLGEFNELCIFVWI